MGETDFELVEHRNPDVDEMRGLAPVFVYEGMWIFDCHHVSCFSAQRVPGWRAAFGVCESCGETMRLVWPDQAEAIAETLERRPLKSTRHWAPGGTRQAVLSGYPEGQTVDDLRRENREHGVA